jgi:hypothetical protein
MPNRVATSLLRVVDEADDYPSAPPSSTTPADSSPDVRFAPTVAIQARSELSALAAMLTADVYGGASVAQCFVARIDDVFLTAVAQEPLSPNDAAAIACSYLQHLVDAGDYTQQTVDKASQIITRLATYMTVRAGVDDVRGITHRHVIQFLNAPTVSSEPPAARTWDNRRWGADTLFRVLRSLSLYEGDPLVDERRDRPPTIACRALSDSENASCRARSARTIDDLRGPVTFALAEATATTSEISRVTDADVDLPNGRVWLALGGRGAARWGYFTKWGLPKVTRLVEVRAGSDALGTPLVYRGGGASACSQSAVCMSMKATLRRAGLGSDPTVKPRSVRLWAARKLYDTTGDLEEVRHRLGVKRLDDARRMLDTPWGRCDLPPDHRRSS